MTFAAVTLKAQSQTKAKENYDFPKEFSFRSFVVFLRISLAYVVFVG